MRPWRAAGVDSGSGADGNSDSNGGSDSEEDASSGARHPASSTGVDVDATSETSSDGESSSESFFGTDALETVGTQEPLMPADRDRSETSFGSAAVTPGVRVAPEEMEAAEMPDLLTTAGAAISHLRRGLQGQPDSCLYAACLSQLLVAYEALGGTQGTDALAEIESANDVSVMDSQLGGKEEAEEMLSRLAQAKAQVPRELWLHWLQRHKPSGVRAIAQACTGLLQVDGGSDRGLNELALLLPLLHGSASDIDELTETLNCMCTDSQRLARSSAAPDELTAAAHSLPLYLALQLAAQSVEFRSGDAGAWWLLAYALRQVARGGTAGNVCIKQTGLLSWWASCLDWWPDACYRVHSVPTLPSSAANESANPLWRSRQRCAQMLLLALDCDPSASSLSIASQEALQPILRMDLAHFHHAASSNPLPLSV
jgi:hypothetical protein